MEEEMKNPEIQPKNKQTEELIKVLNLNFFLIRKTKVRVPWQSY